MRPRVRIIVLACAACAVAHLPSSTAAPVMPPLVHAITRAIASIFVHTAVSRGIPEDDRRTTTSLESMQEVLHDVSDRVIGSNRHDMPLTWVKMMMGLGHAIASKLTARNEQVSVQLDLERENFSIERKVVSPTPHPSIPAPASAGTSKGRPVSQLKLETQAGLKVFRGSTCRSFEECTSYPPPTDEEYLSGKYYRPTWGSITIANSIEQLHKLAKLICLTHPEASGKSLGIVSYVKSGSDGEPEISVNCQNEQGFRLAGQWHFKIREGQDPLQDVANQPGMIDLPASTESVAQLVNEVWKTAASKPNYKGIDFQEKKPIEGKDVQQWFDKEPDKIPTFKDFFSSLNNYPDRGTTFPKPSFGGSSRNIPPTVPVDRPDRVPGKVPDTLPGAIPGNRPNTHPGVSPGIPPSVVPDAQPGHVPDTLPGTVPGAVPGTHPDALPSDVAGTGTVAGVGSATIPGADVRTGVGQNVNVVNQPSVHVANPVRIEAGDVPKIDIPTLESTPTAQMILKPLLNLFPGFRSWQPPAHRAECPRPTFHVFQQAVRMDAMCDIAQQNRAPIYTSMMLVFALAAVFIVLSA